VLRDNAITEIDPWAELNPAAVFNMPGTVPTAAMTDTTPGVGRSAGPGRYSHSDGKPLWHPDHPMFWVGGLLAVTVGLVAASTELRVGPFRAAFSARRKGSST
jgi:hypothetical protein